MPTNNNTKTASAPEPSRKQIRNAAELLMAALQASAALNTATPRRTSQARTEELAQELTQRDRAALAQMGWEGCRLSSPKPSEPKPTMRIKAGPSINPATYGDLSPDRQASAQFWAGLCSVLARSGGRVWLPEAAAVAAHLGIRLTSPTQLATRLSSLTGLPVSRPVTEAGWLVCEISEEMPAADLWSELFNSHLQAFTDRIAAGD